MGDVKSFLNKVICGNSLEVLKTLPDESVNLIITSPPYFGCRVYGDETLGREENPLDYIDHLFEFMVQLKRVLMANGSLYINLSNLYYGDKGFSRNQGTWKRKTDYHYKSHKIAKPDGKILQHKQLLLLPSMLAIKMQEDGWLLRNQIVWEKNNALPNFSPDRRLPVYEHIFHFVKSKKYYFDYETAKKLGSHRDVIRCNIEPYKEHQASFPEKLITPLVLTTSKENDIVLDPFGGSGTVGAVCVRNKRNYILVDMVEKYCIIAEKRIKESMGVQVETEENVEKAKTLFDVLAE